MAFTLKTITFNHDTASSTNSALNIRRNKDFEVPLPEYNSSMPLPLKNAPAAYAISETQGQNVFIKVRFTNSSGEPATFEVKASGGGILGSLDPVQVIFGAGVQSVTVNIPLNHRNYDSVGRHKVTWEWSYRTRRGTWQNLTSTTHRIYIILSLPPSPWTQAFGDKRNPWSDLLEESCSVASGSKTNETAAEKITKKINSGYSLRYDIITGAHRYGYRNTGNSFFLTNWIDYVIKGNPPGGVFFCQGGPEQYNNYLIVNCYDCAASLTVMTKVLGVPVEYYFHNNFGYLKYVEPIGRSKCNNPFYGCLGNNPVVGPDDPRTGFGNHAYTRLNASGDHDACMKEWLSALTKFLLIFIWLLILIITLGLVNLKSLLLRAGGWLINLSQPTYESRTIDKSAPFEQAAAVGSPVLQTFQISVT